MMRVYTTVETTRSAGRIPVHPSQQLPTTVQLAQLQPMQPQYRSRMTHPLLPHTRQFVPLVIAPHTQEILILMPS